MFSKKIYAITLTPIFVFLFTILTIAQTHVTDELDIATDLRYLETYNITELRYDPLWHAAINPEELNPTTLSVQNDLAYLTTYNIVGLEDDPLWRSLDETQLVAQADRE